MKKLLLLALLIVSGFIIAHYSAARTSVNKHHLIVLQDTAAGWKKADTWTGMKDSKKYYYKINPKSQTIYATLNSKSWSAVIGSVWIDKDGRWIKLLNKKLVVSTDSGSTWTELNGGQWQDADGDWCMFSSAWVLYVKKA